jgi:phosphoribosylglycinamide formyltransferase-1
MPISAKHKSSGVAMPSPVLVTALVSGRGTNLMALHEKRDGYSIHAVVSNNPDSAGLTWAAEQGIATHTVVRQDHGSLVDFKAALLNVVTNTKPDIVALAGFMVVLQPAFVETFAGRLINIHPSLLPKFPGLDTHQRALDSNDTEHGATVHFVTAGVDTGPIIAQGRVPVYSGDTAEALAERTLSLEHKLYPWVLKHLASGAIAHTQTGVTYSDQVRSEAQSAGYTLP